MFLRKNIAFFLFSILRLPVREISVILYECENVFF